MYFLFKPHYFMQQRPHHRALTVTLASSGNSWHNDLCHNWQGHNFPFVHMN